MHTPLNPKAKYHPSYEDSGEPRQSTHLSMAGATRAPQLTMTTYKMTIVLILPELGWPTGFFDYYFPVLGSDFELGALGVMQCLIGASVLSHLVKVFPLVSGFFLFSIGCLNMLISLIFRKRAKSTRSILSFRDRADDMLSSLDKTKEAPFSKYRMDRDAEMGVGVKEPDTAHART